MAEGSAREGRPHRSGTNSRQSEKKRAQSMNHLLAFTLPPIPEPAAPPRRTRRGTYKPFSRERYVNGHYRFIMHPSGDYTAHYTDPDIDVHWPQVAEVIVHISSDVSVAHARGRAVHATESGLTTSETACPICLSPPAAPRMTKCGHVFCLQCVRRYLALDNKGELRRNSALYEPKRCPICWDSVCVTDLKPVHWLDAKHAATHHAENVLSIAAAAAQVESFPQLSQLKDQGLVTFRLLCRSRDSTLALPRSNVWPRSPSIGSSDPTPFWFQQDVMQYARMMLATPAFLIESLQEDLLAIEEEAEMLRHFRADNQTMYFVGLARNDVNAMLERATSELDNPALHARIELANVPSEPASLSNSTELTAGCERMCHSVPEAKVDAKQYSGLLYFYQAASGENVFLQAGDTKVLLEHYGTYSNFPDTLHVIVRSAKDTNVDDALRRRFKYLAHLPESSDVVFATVDWQRTAALLRGIQPSIAHSPRSSR